MIVQELLQANVLIPWMLGMLFGVFVGSTPGLTATMAVALVAPIGYAISTDDPTPGMALIIGVSFTAIFAGDIPATFLRIPGTPASAAATLDGHEMAKRGKGNLALTLDLFCSVIGGIIGVALLMMVAPQLARFALLFSSFEYFWLGIFGLSLSALVSRGSLFKGLLAVALGVLVSTVGIDDVSGTSRYTFGNPEMYDGINFIPAMIGLFGLSEVLRNLRDGGDQSQHRATVSDRVSMVKTLAIIWRHKWRVLISSLTGTVIGALPGAGADIAAWGAYGIAQKTSKHPEKFGTGTVEGVIAPTSANNAAIGGAWIPALVFGVPGDAVTAIVLGVLLNYGIKSGPLLFENNPDKIHAIFVIALITQFLLLPAGFLGIKVFGWIMRLPRAILLTLILLFSVVGSYALNNSLFDVYVMFAFGLIGFFLESRRVPLAPLVLGMILGPLVESKLRQGLIGFSGDITPMFTRPICAVLVSLLVFALIGPWVWKLIRRRTTKGI